MPDDEEFECPECGALITTEMSSCPSCGIELEWDEGGQESSDEVEDAAEEHPEQEGEGPSGVEEEPEPDHEPHEEPPPSDETPPVEGPKLYGGLSVVGLAFAILAALAVVLTLVAANYDVWVQGAEEEAIGSTQRTAIYGGVAGIIVCLLVAVWDWMRNRG